MADNSWSGTDAVDADADVDVDVVVDVVVRAVAKPAKVSAF